MWFAMCTKQVDAIMDTQEDEDGNLLLQTWYCEIPKKTLPIVGLFYYCRRISSFHPEGILEWRPSSPIVKTAGATLGISGTWTGTSVELPMFLKTVGSLPHSNPQQRGASDYESETLTTRPQTPLLFPLLTEETFSFIPTSILNRFYI